MKRKQLSQNRIAGICRGFALLLHAGMGLGDSAQLLRHEETGDLRELLAELETALDQGKPLWEAMERTGVFPVYVRGMVRIGEETGRLEEALNGLADYCEESVALQRQIKNAVAWPALLMLLMLVVIGVLLVKVMPVFDAVYASLGSRLTGLSAGMLALGQILSRGMPVLLAVLMLLVLVAAALAMSEQLRQWVTNFWQRRFGDRGIHRKFNNARFARALAMALGSGLAIEDAMELGQGLLTDVPGAVSRIGRCRALLEQETPLAQALEETNLLSASCGRILAVGLRGGNADRVMEDVASRMMTDARESLEDIVAKVEPAMVLLSSLLVGVILLSAMLPLMNIMAAMG